MEQGYDAATLRYITDGVKPRFKRPESSRRKDWTEIEGEKALENEYQRLLWTFGERFVTIEQARLAEFDWAVGRGIGYDDLAKWVSQGATVRDKQLLFGLAKAKITPDHTSQWWTSTARESMTIMNALLSRAATVADVSQLIARGDLTA